MNNFTYLKGFTHLYTCIYVKINIYQHITIASGNKIL